jgi:DNA-binding HxlR family transcriptional regulator
MRPTELREGLLDRPTCWDAGSVKDGLALVRGKWTIELLVALWHGARRPAELRVELPFVQERVLLATLRSLVERGIVARTQISALPVSRVEYSLTPEAYELADLFSALACVGRRCAPLPWDVAEGESTPA